MDGRDIWPTVRGGNQCLFGDDAAHLVVDFGRLVSELLSSFKEFIPGPRCGFKLSLQSNVSQKAAGTECILRR